MHLHTLDQSKKEKEVNNICKRQVLGGASAQIIRKATAALALLVFSGVAYAQEVGHDRKEAGNFGTIPSPTTPERITPDVGSSAFLLGHAFGTQGYVCLPNPTGGVSWTVNNARPEATLFTNIFGEAVQIITHFLSPVVNPNDIGPNPPRFGDATWQSSFDSSRVWAQKKDFITAGTDASCPNGGSIDCLLLQVIGSDNGPTGGKSLTKTTFIQRLNTKGGSAPANPATGCLASGDVGHQVLVPYTADYYFFRNDQ
jgi:hypothetical protein